ncbi:hypothetical protein AB4Y45_32855 [Paraburkholderia sp. EG287A]|uniref:hypothetical protein n=1 Tax=Paraburkholderia sp. EG287A TaxID=3237012 RepID=UPI0034D1ABAD
MELSLPFPHEGFGHILNPEDPEHLERVLNRLAASSVFHLQLETDEDCDKWCDSLCLFLASDIEAASRAKWFAQHPTNTTATTSANEQVWLRVGSPDGVDDVIRSYQGLQAALTDLLEDTLEHGTYPEYIEVSEQRIRFTFNNDWQEWIEFRLVHPDSATCFPEQARYTGLLTGLAASEKPSETFIKRLGELPGWGGATLARSEHARSDAQWHAPLPKEWRRVGTEILHRVGLTDATPAQVEEVVCAVLDFPSWNHLAAAYKNAVSGPCGIMVYRTCYCSEDDTVLFEQTHGTIESALHCLVTSVQSTAKLSLGWTELQIASHAADGDIEISAPNSQDKGRWTLTWAFFATANSAPAALQSWVRSYFDGRPLTVEALNEMFMLNMNDSTERSNIADSLCDMTVLAQVGTRRLYKQPPWPRHTGCRMTVHTLSSDGSRAPGFGVFFSSDKASLLFDEPTGYTALVEPRGAPFEILTAFSEDETDFISAIRVHLLPDNQKLAKEYLAGLDFSQRKIWKKKLVDAAEEARKGVAVD